MRVRSSNSCSRQQQLCVWTACAIIFQDGGPPWFNLKLDGKASNSGRPGKSTKGPRYATYYRHSESSGISLKLQRRTWRDATVRRARASAAAIGRLSLQLSPVAWVSTASRITQVHGAEVRVLVLEHSPAPASVEFRSWMLVERTWAFFFYMLSCCRPRYLPFW